MSISFSYVRVVIYMYADKIYVQICLHACMYIYIYIYI